MEKSYEDLQVENELLRKELQSSQRSKGEFWWILLARATAFVIGFLPFIPNSLYYLGLREDKISIGTGEVFFVAIGFAMLWGSKNFGSWANELGKKFITKT